jgi:hypothetical protein
MKKLRLCMFLFLSLVLCGASYSAEPFPLKDVEVEYDMGMSMVQGEITNNSGKSYEGALFKLSFYDGNNKLLGAADIAIENFGKGETVTFEGVSEKNLSKWETFKIRLNTSY